MNCAMHVLSLGIRAINYELEQRFAILDRQVQCYGEICERTGEVRA